MHVTKSAPARFAEEGDDPVDEHFHDAEAAVEDGKRGILGHVSVRCVS
jgi:hypothetical protein